VTKGGIPVEEVDGNLQSKIVKNLYFAGEILDVDGDCGGYNLTFAFASGMHVAHKICEGINADD
ncbi:MAG: NAD(P)/FAD-dependent oxidoreductase, partial [Clostridia bacterium]|nr:NAD(P)/FAD-dependent oxidoreductase [Clostridia bacterium]